MNAATAGGILGGEATASVTYKPAPGELVMNADCSFVLANLSGPEKPALTIRVHTGTRESVAKDVAAACNSNTARLTGVGNEAVSCESHSQDKTVMQVTGRVRRRVFELRWTIPDDSTAAALTPDARRAVLQNAAEQVAGSLF